MNKDELQKYFREHVVYEVNMFATTRTLLSRENLEITLKNPILESWVMHMRCLVAFLYPHTYKPYPTDVAAWDYFSAKKMWSALCGHPSGKLKKAKQRADREVGHLTKFRQYGEPSSKYWAVSELTDELLSVFKVFTEHADLLSLDAVK